MFFVVGFFLAVTVTIGCVVVVDILQDLFVPAVHEAKIFFFYVNSFRLSDSQLNIKKFALSKIES